MEADSMGFHCTARGKKDTTELQQSSARDIFFEAMINMILTRPAAVEHRERNGFGNCA